MPRQDHPVADPGIFIPDPSLLERKVADFSCRWEWAIGRLRLGFPPASALEECSGHPRGPRKEKVDYSKDGQERPRVRQGEKNFRMSEDRRLNHKAQIENTLPLLL